MPVITARINSKLLSKVFRILESDQYASIDQLVELALTNQLALEQEHGVPERPDGERRRPPRMKASTDSPPQELVGSSWPTDVLRYRRLDETFTQLLSDVQYPESVSNQLSTCSARARPANEKMYGLVNRLFPVKFILRWLDVRSEEAGRWLSLSDVTRKLSEDASVFGSALTQLDRKNDRKRDDQFSTGLPRLGYRSSATRFTSQFMARTTRDGNAHPGAIIQYSYAAIKNGHVVLTEKGRELASADNPILDGEIDRAEQSLSDEEKRTIIEQIRTFVPAESKDARLVVTHVRDGATTPIKLLNAVRNNFPEEASLKAVRSYLGGLIGRMADTGVLTRRWEGRNAFYSEGPMAEQLVGNGITEDSK